MLVPVVELYLTDLTILLKWICLLQDFVSRHGNCSWMSISCWQALRVPDLWASVVQIRPQGGWMALKTWGEDMYLCLAEIPDWLPIRTVWGCVWPLNDPGWLFWGAAPERREGDLRWNKEWGLNVLPFWTIPGTRIPVPRDLWVTMADHQLWSRLFKGLREYCLKQQCQPPPLQLFRLI